ncbi:MAG: hypothetical protein VW397_09300, partial [Candidatus Margulisiibacteriota bacterium]
MVQSFSVRSMGRGGAAIAQPYGAESLASNPAGLAQKGSGLHYNSVDFENTHYTKNDALLYHRNSFGVGSWAIENNTNRVTAFNLGFANRNRNGVDWGLVYKSIDYEQNGISQSFWSSDLGVILHLNPAFDVGMVGKNILGKENRPFSSSFQGGFLYKNRDASLKIFSDVVADNDNTDYSDSYVRYGLDYDLTPDFTIRFGGDELYYTSGVSFDFSFLSFDYAVKSPKSNQSESVYALGVRLGRAREPEEFRRKYAMFKPNAIAYIEINGALTSGYSSISLLGGRKIGSNDIIQLINKANYDDDCEGYL